MNVNRSFPSITTTRTSHWPKLFLKVAAPATIQSFLQKNRDYLENPSSSVLNKIEGLSSADYHNLLREELRQLRQNPKYQTKNEVFNRRYRPNDQLAKAFQLKAPIDIVYDPKVNYSGKIFYRTDSPWRIVMSHRGAPTLLHELGHASIYQDPWKRQRLEKLTKVMGRDRFEQLNERLANARVRKILRQNPDVIRQVTGISLTPEEYMNQARYAYGTYQRSHLERALNSIDQGTYNPRKYSYTVRQLANVYDQHSGGTPPVSKQTTSSQVQTNLSQGVTPQSPAGRNISAPGGISGRWNILRNSLSRMGPAVRFTGTSLLGGLLTNFILKSMESQNRSNPPKQPSNVLNYYAANPYPRSYPPV